MEKQTVAMPGSRKFCQRESKFDGFFLIDGGDRGSKYRFNWAIIGPPANAFEMAFRWRADDGPTLNAGLVAL